MPALPLSTFTAPPTTFGSLIPVFVDLRTCLPLECLESCSPFLAALRTCGNVGSDCLHTNVPPFAVGDGLVCQISTETVYHESQIIDTESPRSEENTHFSQEIKGTPVPLAILASEHDEAASSPTASETTCLVGLLSVPSTTPYFLLRSEDIDNIRAQAVKDYNRLSTQQICYLVLVAILFTVCPTVAHPSWPRDLVRFLAKKKLFVSYRK